MLPPGFQVTPSKGRLFAANKTEILLHGEVELPFHVDERQLSAVVSVTDVVDELILGIDWLAKNRCAWDFTKGSLQLNGELVKLCGRSSKDKVRRIYAEEDVEIPAWTQAEVPVSVISVSYTHLTLPTKRIV